MQIKSNALVKFIVPAVVIAGLAVGLKSCKNEPAEQPQAKQSGSLKNLSPDELKALGVEGDTPEDTLRTLIGRLNDVRDRQKTLDKQNADLVKENERLRRRNQDVSGQVNEAVNGLREQYDKRQAQLQNEQLSLTAKIQELTDKLKKPDSEKKTADSDIPLGLGLDGMGSSTGGSASQGSDGMMWVAPTDHKETDPRDAASGKASPQFPTSFLGENELTRQRSAAPGRTACRCMAGCCGCSIRHRTGWRKPRSIGRLLTQTRARHLKAPCRSAMILPKPCGSRRRFQTRKTACGGLTTSRTARWRWKNCVHRRSRAP